MAERVEIFNGTLQPAIGNLTDAFTDPSFLYMEIINVPGEAEIDMDLQIYLPNNNIRRVPLIGEEQRAIDTFSIWFVPSEIQASEYELRLELKPSDALDAIIYAVKAGCTCEAKLNEINTKLNIQLASQLLSKIVDVAVPLLTTIANPQLLLPAVAANVVRGVIEIINPSTTEPLLIGYDTLMPTLANHTRLIEPGGRLLVNEWQGKINAAANGITPIVREYSRE